MTPNPTPDPAPTHGWWLLALAGGFVMVVSLVMRVALAGA